jgi:hypothetical protein
MVIIFFTPFDKRTVDLAKHNDPVPTISFNFQDILSYFPSNVKWTLDGPIQTKTQYGMEYILKLEKK